MTDNKKILNSHRKMNEIGGILLGVGLGIFIARKIGDNVLIEVVVLIVGFVILVVEQKKWSKLKEL